MISYVKEESVAYRLRIKVMGEGSVHDGDAMIRNDEKHYTLPVDETRIFEINADEGKIIKKIELDGTPIAVAKDSNKLIIKGAQKDQSLVVIFESQEYPQTGIFKQNGGYILLTLIAFLFIMQMVLCTEKDEAEA